MRNLIVSTDVFAALWARRRPSEDSENAILERLLGLPKGPPLPAQTVMAAPPPRDGSIYNRMFDVHFPQGFEVFRTYKGKAYSAIVRAGCWVMNGTPYPSLFALSTAVADSRENPWVHWKYRDAAGRVNFIRALRRPVPELEEPPAKPRQSRGVKKRR